MLSTFQTKIAPVALDTSKIIAVYQERVRSDIWALNIMFVNANAPVTVFTGEHMDVNDLSFHILNDIENKYKTS